MTVEVPAAYATGTPADTLTQFFTMKKMGGYGKTNYTTVFCETTPVNATAVSQTVEQWFSSNLIESSYNMWTSFSGDAAKSATPAWEISTGKLNDMYLNSTNIPGYKTISCEAMLKIDKEGRDDTFFGEYEFSMGTELKRATSPNWLIASDVPLANMKLVAPVIDKKVSTSDYSIQSIGYEWNEFIDFTKFTNKPTEDWAWGEQSVELLGLFSPFVYADDIARFSMNLTAPSETLPNGTVVYQYMQLQNLYDDSSDYISMGCRYTVGKNNSEVVEAFRGTERLNEGKVTGKKVGEQNKATQLSATEAFFTKN